jgi:hypothetical protein
MDNLPILLPFLAALAILLFGTLRRIQCPDCGDPLPGFCSPWKKTRRMWRAGGHLCARCGCETDMTGRKVTPDTPFPPFPIHRWAVLSISLLVGIGLGTSVWFVTARAVAAPPITAGPPVAVPPAVAAPPQQLLPPDVAD